MARKRKRDPLEDLDIADLEKMIDGWRTWSSHSMQHVAEPGRRCAFCYTDVGTTKVLAGLTSESAPLTYVCPGCFHAGKIEKVIETWLSWIEIKNSTKI